MPSPAPAFSLTALERKMLVDQKCYELACHFMDGLNWRPEDKQELAEAIQQLCEDMTRISDEDPDAPFNNADTPFAENH